LRVGIRIHSWLTVSGALLVLSAFVLVACASAPRGGPSADAAGSAPSPAGSPAVAVVKDYMIYPGDVIDIKFYHSPELNEQVIVRPDGRISIQLAHEVMAAGLTPAQLKEILTDKVSHELRQPEVTVIVRSFNTHIFVDGEVARPGAFPLIEATTVLEAIALAGGMRDTARLREVVVIRRGPANAPLAIPVNVEKAARGEDPAQNIALLPSDVVFVPRKRIGNVNVWVDQYIRRNIPLGIGAGYNLNPQ
jgi:polysaccharide biosynthesis/export protein